MTVRGAGAIGATAGYAMAQGALAAGAAEDAFRRDFAAAAEFIEGTRPTAQARWGGRGDCISSTNEEGIFRISFVCKPS